MVRLLAVMARLRDPEGGCPWDLEQSFRTIAPHTIEEAYEVADAIERGDMTDLKDELGDLLFQIVYYARMAEEAGAFDFDDVARTITDKMIRRHPHVFGAAAVDSADEMTQRWEDHKAKERAEKAAASGRLPSALDDIVGGLPALSRALKLQKRAARVGFDWKEAEPILDKIEEEICELRAVLTETRETAIMAEPDTARIEDELGDCFFALANLGRHLGIDPEAAARHTNAKFERRFRRMESWLAETGLAASDLTLTELETLWQRAKAEEPGRS
ncbi:MAG: nucleoside triphosphate pyrophosphohydrolase [Alphaproteobacteria bacterium]|nr:nucleoside triphosphate pyrophosphohydrolase [Alphaproteobacteria bacterium]